MVVNVKYIASEAIFVQTTNNSSTTIKTTANLYTETRYWKTKRQWWGKKSNSEHRKRVTGWPCINPVASLQHSLSQSFCTVQELELTKNWLFLQHPPPLKINSASWLSLTINNRTSEKSAVLVCPFAQRSRESWAGQRERKVRVALWSARVYL